MSTKVRTGSALSSSSNELIDKQLNELIEDSDSQRANKTGPSNERSRSTTGGEEAEENADCDENVAVMVRCRPLFVAGAPSGQQPQQQQQEPVAVVKVDEANKCVLAEERQFFFDQVFGTDCDNEQVYMRSARRLVDCAFRGYNCTIFLYGQTGTGKTHTHSGLTLAAFEHLFSLIQDSGKWMRFLIRASYYELYNEEIRDLLAPKSAAGGAKSLELRESKERGVYVKNLTCFLVNNLGELKKLKQLGDKRRTTASTRMNEHSSRSHSIFSITIETISAAASDGPEIVKQNETKQSNKSARARESNRRKQSSIRVGRLNLIDLAGSERQSKSGASGVALKEASRINLSLTCLSLVIRALTDNSYGGGPKSKAHIPYRNSKLTRLLSSSLGGNSKTILIACVSPARTNLDETLDTLRFASRTKQIKNRALINEDPKDALLRKYRKQLEELRMKLNEHQRMGASERGRSIEGPVEQLVAAPGEFNLEVDAGDEEGEQMKLNKQLELLKAKIMFGGENLLDKLELHERLLEASRAELEERQREEAKLRQRLQDKKQTIEQVVQSKGSLEGQLEYLDSKLAKAIELYRSSKLELRDLAGEHEQLREQLLQTIKSTSKEIKYVDCIVEDFIPREQLDLINAYAQYDDDSDEWQIKYIALSGNNIAQTKRLINCPMPATSFEQPARRHSRSGARSAGSTGTAISRRASAASTNRADPFLKL